MQMKLELVPIPVADLDRAKAFYETTLGFHVDHDTSINEGAIHLIQLTPPGSACSILLSRGLPGVDMPAGSLRALHLVVKEVSAAREFLVSRNVECGPIADHGGGVKSFGISDPDGNSWVIQEMEWRSPEFN